MKAPTLVSGFGTTARLIEVVTHILLPFGIFPLSLSFRRWEQGQLRL